MRHAAQQRRRRFIDTQDAPAYRPRIMSILAALLLAPLPTAPAPAPTAAPSFGRGLFTAVQLKQRCQSNEPADASYCFAYVIGVHDTVRAYESWLNLREFCMPARLVQADLRRAFVDYLTENPAYAGGEAASVVVVALKVRYACSPGPAATARPAPTPTPRR